MTKYELTIIARENLTVVDKIKIDDTIKEFVDRMKCKTEGVKTLSYPLKEQKRGLYIYYTLWADNMNVSGVNYELAKNDNVLRYLLVRN